eukprot:5776912-Amphidinium_carterae.1
MQQCKLCLMPHAARLASQCASSLQYDTMPHALAVINTHVLKLSHLWMVVELHLDMGRPLRPSIFASCCCHTVVKEPSQH